MRLLWQRGSARLRHPVRKERRVDQVLLLIEVQGQRPQAGQGLEEAQVGQEARWQMSSSKEETLIVVKPDGVERGLVGEIVRRFEAKGFAVEKMQMQTILRLISTNRCIRSIQMKKVAF